MNLKSLSKFLSLVLRHDPSKIGVTLDKNGWVDIDTLLNALQNHGTTINRETLIKIVETDNKKRYAIQDNKIRASQGHSIEVDLELKPITPPDILYHGTQADYVYSIMRNGLKPGSRQYVHMSSNLSTAQTVGNRRGTNSTILTIDAKTAHKDGIKFFKSENDVWLVKHMPNYYLSY